jgi:hypothetical protein
MEALEATMNNHNIDLDSSSSNSSNSSSHEHVFSASSLSFNATSTSSSYEWLIDSGASYHMAKNKVIFLLLMNVTPNKYLLVMIDLLVLYALE